LLQFEIKTCNSQTAALMQRTSKFYYFYIEILHAGSGSCLCQTKSNTAEQNMQNFTISMTLC